MMCQSKHLWTNDLQKVRVESTHPAQKQSRRNFLGTAAAGVGSLSILQVSRMVHASEDNTIQVALVGCGGRGTGAAANALSTPGPTRLVAMADVFPNRLESSFAQLSKQFGEKVDVPPERRFVGFDAYKKAMDFLRPGDVVLLATPPAFRPLHLEYAVSRGLHVFMEKSFAVDAPGVRRVLKAGEEASQKNLKIAGGLMSRHHQAIEETIQRIHDGAIGKVITCWAYRMHGPVGFTPKSPGMSELAHQIRNYSCFTWLNGSFLLDWLIHNLDVSCWVKGQWPISAQGQGGRQVREVPDQLFDHYAVEFHFPDGTRLFAQGRHQAATWGFWGCVIHGSEGMALLGEGIAEPRIYRGHQPENDALLWRYEGPPCNPYQREMDLLFEAIRNDQPYNETERCAFACMVGILGRMAAESGKFITWEEAMASQLELAPGLDNLKSLDDPAPVMPNELGQYPIAKPGITQVL